MIFKNSINEASKLKNKAAFSLRFSSATACIRFPEAA